MVTERHEVAAEVVNAQNMALECRYRSNSGGCLKSLNTADPIEQLWDVVIHIMNVQPTNLQQLRDAIISIWTKISEEV